jgi:hypothetical protein
MQTSVQTETIVYPKSVGPQPELTAGSPFSALARAVFRRRESGAGSVVMFTAPRFDTEVAYVSGCVAAELSRVSDRVLLADARALLQLARRTLSVVERPPAHLGSGRVWTLGVHHVGDDAAATEAIDPAGIADVIRSLRSDFDHVVIDASALGRTRDSRHLAAEVDGIILVARAGCTTEQELLRCSRAITETGGRILGSVLTA